jgi:NADH:ubiquinone oxidoreductase subunit E
VWWHRLQAVWWHSLQAVWWHSLQAVSLRAAAIGASVVVACVLLLTASYVVARIQAPKDARFVADLQKKVRQDSAFAPKLEAEHKRITAVLRQRKKLDDILAIILIAAAALFIASAKLLVGRRPLPMDRLVQLKAGPKVGQALACLRGTEPSHEPPPAFVERIVQHHGRSKEAAIPILQAIQTHYRYLPDEALKRVCELTEITPAQIAGTSSFYAQFRRSPMGRHLVRVCHGTACHVAGARQLTDELRRRLEIPGGADTDPRRMFTVDEVACLGCCSLAPVIMVDGQAVGKLTPAGACEALEGIRSPSLT